MVTECATSSDILKVLFARKGKKSSGQRSITDLLRERTSSLKQLTSNSFPVAGAADQTLKTYQQEIREALSASKDLSFGDFS